MEDDNVTSTLPDDVVESIIISLADLIFAGSDSTWYVRLGQKHEPDGCQTNALE